MTDSTKITIENINKISQQLLSQLDVQEKTQEIKENMPINKILTDLMSERDLLINNLFKQHSSEEISTESVLINNMVSLDSQLILKSQSYKEEIADTLAKFKKGQKSTQSYLKY